MTRLLVLCVIGVLASCATTRPYDSMVASWSGAGENELVRRWGEPTRVYRVGERKFVVYESRRSLYVPGASSYSSITGSTPGGGGLDVELSCVTTFALANDRVVSATYEGNDCRSNKARTIER